MRVRSLRARRLAAALSLAALSALALSAPGCKATGEAYFDTEEGDSTQEGLTGTMKVGATLTVTVDLNLREQPSTAAKILDVMPAGSKVVLQTADPNNGFYQIAYNGKTGWSSGKYLEPASDGASGPAGATLTTTGAVNLRSGPSTSYAALTVIPMGTQVTTVEPEPTDGFYHITYQDLTGWSSGKYLTASSPDAPSNPSGVSSVPFAGGQVWKFHAKTLSVDIAIFVPLAAASAPEVEVLFYVHGLNVCSPVAKNPPLSFVTDAPFSLGTVVADSQRPTVLVVPWMDWEHLAANGMATSGNNHKLGIPANLNGVVAEVLTQVGIQRGADAPALSALLLAGHSRAYGFLNPLAAASADPQMSQGALSKLTRVWGLDSGYVCSTSSWKSWMKSKPSLFVTQDYRSGTGTADCGQQFANIVSSSGGQLSVHAVPEAHCNVPAVEIPKLLGELP